jgi:hypothetical protein
MAGAAVQGAELEGCERWNVLLERRWRHDMPRYDRSRKHGAKRFDRRWMRVRDLTDYVYQMITTGRKR